MTSRPLDPEVQRDVDKFEVMLGRYLAGDLDEPLQGVHRGLELLAEPVVLLVPPRVAEGDELAVQPGQAALEVGVEPLQVGSEPAQLGRVDDRLGHARPPRTER